MRLVEPTVKLTIGWFSRAAVGDSFAVERRPGSFEDGLRLDWAEAGGGS